MIINLLGTNKEELSKDLIQKEKNLPLVFTPLEDEVNLSECSDRNKYEEYLFRKFRDYHLFSFEDISLRKKDGIYQFLYNCKDTECARLREKWRLFWNRLYPKLMISNYEE